MISLFENLNYFLLYRMNDGRSISSPFLAYVASMLGKYIFRLLGYAPMDISTKIGAKIITAPAM